MYVCIPADVCGFVCLSVCLCVVPGSLGVAGYVSVHGCKRMFVSGILCLCSFSGAAKRMWVFRSVSVRLWVPVDVAGCL